MKFIYAVEKDSLEVTLEFDGKKYTEIITVERDSQDNDNDSVVEKNPIDMHLVDEYFGGEETPVGGIAVNLNDSLCNSLSYLEPVLIDEDVGSSSNFCARQGARKTNIQTYLTDKQCSMARKFPAIRRFRL